MWVNSRTDTRLLAHLFRLLLDSRSETFQDRTLAQAVLKEEERLDLH